MKTRTNISVAVVDFSNGTPDPYSLNDAMHVVNCNNPAILWDWVDVKGVGKPTHYVIHNGELSVVGKDAESIIQPIKYALAITNYALDNNLGDVNGDYYVNNPDTGILLISLEGADETEVQFKLIDYPDTWIYCMWRG
jgi:hypothetical protein